MTDRVWLEQLPSKVCLLTSTLPDTPLWWPCWKKAFASTKAAWPTTSWARTLAFGQTDSLSLAVAAYLQGLGLVKGDRVAIMMPNVPQYPVAVAAILRAGFVVVNVNPLYTAA